MRVVVTKQKAQDRRLTIIKRNRTETIDELGTTDPNSRTVNHVVTALSQCSASQQTEKAVTLDESATIFHFRNAFHRAHRRRQRTVERRGTTIGDRLRNFHHMRPSTQKNVAGITAIESGTVTQFCMAVLLNKRKFGERCCDADRLTLNNLVHF